MVSYTRARAECTIPKCKVGFLERPERVVLIILGALFDRMAPVLWVIAVLSNVTVIARMIYTWQEAKQLEEAQLRSVLRRPSTQPSKITCAMPSSAVWVIESWTDVHPQLLGNLGRFPVQAQHRPARRQIRHFEILPAHAAPPARADRLHARFLGREPARVALELVGLALHVGDLGGRVDALDEALRRSAPPRRECGPPPPDPRPSPGSFQLRPGGGERQAAVLHSLGADERVGNLLHGRGFAAHHQHFQAIVVIQVDVQRGKDRAVKVVLHVGEFLVEHADVVVVDERDRAHDVAVGRFPDFCTSSSRMRSRKASDRLV